MTTGDLARMDALVLHGVGDARLESIPRPEPGPGQVRVRVGFCGVCGSDIPRTFVKGTYRFPTVCGHEFAGFIDDEAGWLSADGAGRADRSARAVVRDNGAQFHIGHVDSMVAAVRGDRDGSTPDGDRRSERRNRQDWDR